MLVNREEACRGNWIVQIRYTGIAGKMAIEDDRIRHSNSEWVAVRLSYRPSGTFYNVTATRFDVGDRYLL